ncbi:MAG: HEAT repeat domain-containing protein [Candidatus Acidiferrales bacterium]
MPKRASLLLTIPAVLIFSIGVNAQQPAPPAPPAPASPNSAQQSSQPASQPSSRQQATPPSSAAAQQTAKTEKHGPSPPVATTNLYAACWELLASGMSSDKLRSRSDALSALSVLGENRRAIKMIEGALDDKEESIRSLAATSLGDVHARSSIPLLRAALLDNSPAVSFAAARALWKMGDRSGRDVFYGVLSGQRSNGPGFIKSNLNHAMQELHDPKALALIGVNEGAGALLGPFSMGVSLIEAYAKDNGAPIEALCAQLLASDNTPDTVEELKAALADRNWTVRVAAARSLAEMRRTETIPQLRDMFDDDKQQAAQYVAAAAILRLMEHREVSRAKAAHAKPAATRTSRTASAAKQS